MARTIIESLEMIEIEHQQGQRLIPAARPSDRLVKGIVRRTPIGDTGQPIRLSISLQVASALPELEFVHRNCSQIDQRRQIEIVGILRQALEDAQRPNRSPIRG